MRAVEYSNRFKRDYKRMKKRGKDLLKLTTIMKWLEDNTPLPESMHDHSLIGNWSGTRECHIELDWLLIYSLADNDCCVRLERTGSHSDLFQK